MIGRVHSMESMGLVDGPGVRAVVFLQGCPLRCLYCHNPDTQGAGGTETDSAQLVDRLLRFRSYFDRSGGGVTFSGGEPLAQPDFLLDCLRRLKAAGTSCSSAQPAFAYSSVRPSSARRSVTSSIFSRSPPTGTPLAIRVTRIPVGLISLLIYIAVVSPPDWSWWR